MPRPRDMQTIPLEQFTISNDTLVAEASDFGPLRDGLWWLQSMYSTAADHSIAILSHHTGKIARFVHAHTRRDRENEILHWEFELAIEPGNNSKIKKVMIIND